MMQRHRYGRLLAFLGMAIASVWLTGCQSIPYYSHIIGGQLSLLNQRRPVADVVTDPGTPPELKARLKLATELVEFAQTRLLLPAGGQYETYVGLDRPYAVWTVFAAPEFSLDPLTWCFPLIGCSAYRGYFSEEKARRYAQQLDENGYDVVVGGAWAYSTLGWFSDPLLSTFIGADEPQLAALLFHELAHQLLYVRDDTAFNESFATALAHEGLRRWYDSKGEMAKYRRYMRFYQRRQTIIGLIDEYRNRLEALYRKKAPAVVMRRRKAELFDALRREFDRRRSNEKKLEAFNVWFETPLNNARLVSIATYHDYVAAFGRLLESVQFDLERFYQKCRELSEYPPEKRREFLLNILQPSQPPVTQGS